MGTRGTLKFKNQEGEFVASLYFQYDSYPSGWPDGVKGFLQNAKFGNGISGSPKLGEYFNGFYDLGAQVIRYVKGDRVGNVYLTSSGDEEEYNYVIEETETGYKFYDADSKDVLYERT